MEGPKMEGPQMEGSQIDPDEYKSEECPIEECQIEECQMVGSEIEGSLIEGSQLEGSQIEGSLTDESQREDHGKQELEDEDIEEVPSKVKMAPNVVDLEELVISWAWNTFVRTRSKDYSKLRFEDLKFDVVWDRVRFVAGRPVYSGEKKLNKPHSQVVFKSVYENKTGNVQDHSFQTNRTTVSSCNTTVCKGYTKGINLELKLGLPEEIMSATAGFGREVTMESSDDFTHEETISWSINSNIKVPPQHKTIAELVVKEQEYTASFKMCARIRGHLVVMLTNLRDNNSFVQSIEADFADIMREHAETHSKHFTIEGHVVNWEVLGKCQFRYGVEQHVQLTDQPLVETDLSATD